MLTLQEVTTTDFDLDEDGYLKDFSDWTKDAAESLSGKDGIMLTPDHWEILLFMREYYMRYDSCPMPKVIVREINKMSGADKFTVKSLYTLFSDAPVSNAAKYAGLPRPAQCT